LILVRRPKQTSPKIKASTGRGGTKFFCLVSRKIRACDEPEHVGWQTAARRGLHALPTADLPWHKVDRASRAATPFACGAGTLWQCPAHRRTNVFVPAPGPRLCRRPAAAHALSTTAPQALGSPSSFGSLRAKTHKIP
jgi:hypothetical protein